MTKKAIVVSSKSEDKVFHSFKEGQVVTFAEYGDSRQDGRERSVRFTDTSGKLQYLRPSQFRWIEEEEPKRKFLVEIEERLQYRVIVEAYDAEDAKKLALSSDKYQNDECDMADGGVTAVTEIKPQFSVSQYPQDSHLPFAVLKDDDVIARFKTMDAAKAFKDGEEARL